MADPPGERPSATRVGCASAHGVDFACGGKTFVEAQPTARTAPAPIAPRSSPTRETLGICQWFHFEDDAGLKRTVATLRRLNVKHVRTGISWADFFRPGGKAWYDRQMNALREFDVLLSVWHTPPSLSEGNACSAPPRRLLDYADFIDRIITEYGDTFTHLELWNEPNNRFKWDFVHFDSDWSKFAEMIGAAAYWAKQRGRQTVLGGIIPVDHHWLELMRQRGVLQYIDVIAIHAFPGMWFPNHPNWDWQDRWDGWEQKLAYVRQHFQDKPVWVTETGLSTWDLALRRVSKYDLQQRMLDEAAGISADRVYWYSLYDLDPARDAIEGFHVDENEYHMGLIAHDGHEKFACERMERILQSDGDGAPGVP